MNQKWKASRFNEYLGELDKGRWVIYNNLSGAMLEFSQNIYQNIQSNSIENIQNQGDIEMISMRKIIVPHKLDEVDGLKKIRDQDQENVKSIGLQILPTLACNFKCVYCYEQLSNAEPTMSVEVMDEIAKYLRKKIMPTTQFLNVLWFGGEPLLAIEKIEMLTSRFIEICENSNVKYFSGMISNGYLLTKRTAETLLKNKIDFCQVTIDGPEEIHDRRRMLKNGGNTWKTLISNVSSAISLGLRIAIRINLDKTNIDSIDELAENLQEHDLLDKVKISFGIVSSFGNACRSMEDSMLSVPDANNIIKKKELVKFLESKDIAHRVRPDSIICVATSKNSLIIGPRGELYKCSKNVGEIGEQCGTIFDFDNKHPNFLKWNSYNNLNIDKCKKCSILPVCNGKDCAFHYIIKKKNVFDCDQKETKAKYIKRLKNIYFQAQK